MWREGWDEAWNAVVTEAEGGSGGLRSESAAAASEVAGSVMPLIPGLGGASTEV